MNTLEKLAKRIGEIGDEIDQRKSQRETNLIKCNGSIDDEFSSYWMQEIEGGKHDLFNCLMASYAYAKESGDLGEYISFEETIRMYGCANCVGAYNEKQAIGKLKQERGRLVGIISKIGKSL